MLAAAAGVAVLLAAKPPLEAFSRALTTEELFSVIVPPVLPNRGYGPCEALNPREIWTVVVLVSALSFVGFVAMRLLGERRGAVVRITGGSCQNAPISDVADVAPPTPARGGLSTEAVAPRAPPRELFDG